MVNRYEPEERSEYTRRRRAIRRSAVEEVYNSVCPSCRTGQHTGFLPVTPPVAKTPFEGRVLSAWLNKIGYPMAGAKTQCWNCTTAKREVVAYPDARHVPR